MLNILNSRKGFTLTELLVTMAISGVVMAGVYSVFYTQQKSYTTQEQVSEMQQNLRAAMLMISRDARMAGFGLASGRLSYYNGASMDSTYAIEIYNNNPDQIDIVYADASCATTLRNDKPQPSSEFDVNDASCFSLNDLVILSDGTNADIVQITQVQVASKKIQHNPSSPVNSPGGTSVKYDVGANVYKVKYLSYEINNSDPTHPKMRVDLDGPLGGGTYQPLAQNIEDLQVVYIFNDGGEAASYNDSDGDDTNDSADIRSVRINILARSDKVDPGFTGNRPAIEDHAAGGTDSYRRRLLRTGIRVRNLGL